METKTVKTRRRVNKLLITCLISAIIISLIQISPPVFAASAFQDTHSDDMRGAWISTVWSADFPKAKDNADAQKEEFIKKLDALQGAGINTVMVQVRPKADALYQSSINPWSDVLTGTQGKYPGYDPMAFMISEAHKRGMSFHAWLNPYRITTTGANVNDLAANHPARLNPQWTITYKNALYYNPELPEVEQHICDTVAEIVDKYDVDGIHFDDYFYPSGYPLPSGETKDGAVANARRGCVNHMVSAVYQTIKAHDSSVLFGISPIGIWKNNKSDPAGSNTTGGEGYYSVFGDAAAWINAGTVDYIVPQLYWEIGHSQADYETLVKWWSNLVTGTNVKLYIGQGIYRDSVAKEIDAHLRINDNYSNVKGDVYFSAKDIWENRMNCKDLIRTYYASVDQSAPGTTTPAVPPAPTVKFKDISDSAWYYKDVEAACSLGIINGKGDNIFDPEGNLKVAEAITMAVKVKNNQEGTTFVAGGTNWYDNAVAYAISNNIITANDFSNYEALITREQMAYIFDRAMASSNPVAINYNFTVPDISNSPYLVWINDLYSFGILTGTGTDKAFKPTTNITRAESSAIIHRLAVAEKRIKF